MGTTPGRVEWGQVLEDWVTIWQSELACWAVDREIQEALLRGGELWAAQARAAAQVLAPMLQASHERAAGSPGADAPPGAPPVDAASDGRDAVIARLLARVDELERRAGAVPEPGPANPG